MHGMEPQHAATLEWFGPDDAADVEACRAIRARINLYHASADALWGELKAALADAVRTRNARIGGTAPIEWAETLTGGFTVTRFQHPMALLDVLTDIESGMVACVYTLTARETGSCRERLNVLLMRGTESDLYLTSQHGQRFESLDDSANEVLRPYLSHLDGERRELARG